MQRKIKFAGLSIPIKFEKNTAIPGKILTITNPDINKTQKIVLSICTCDFLIFLSTKNKTIIETKDNKILNRILIIISLLS